MEDERLNQSLDDIIVKRSPRKTNLKTRGGARNASNNRSRRASKPYEDSNSTTKINASLRDGEMETKFLVSNYVAGLLIGKGGVRIRKFAAMTKTIIVISHIDEVYPGTNLRFILIRGSLDAITLVVSIFWEIIGVKLSAGSSLLTSI